MNPQIRFGEDLMSRVSYAMLHEGGAAAMTGAVREAIGSLVTGLAARAEVEVEEILEISIVGNPIMHHLLLGIDPTPLGSAPFALATDRAVRTTARELEIPAHPGARVYVLPCIAGHVGADAAGAILAETPYLADEVTLLVDVGTNAEIVLGSKDRLLAASSPTGPAFEGAQISCGQRAAPGAIERVRIDKDTLEPRFRVIGSSRWSDETGFEASTRRTGVTGVCGSGIVEVIAELFLAGVITADGTIDGRLAERSPRLIADGRTFSYVLSEGGAGASLGDGEVGPASPRLLITAERRPRDPAREGRAVRGRETLDGPSRRGDASTRSSLPARSAARSILCTRWSSGSCRTRRWTASARPGTPRAPER